MPIPRHIGAKPQPIKRTNNSKKNINTQQKITTFTSDSNNINDTVEDLNLPNPTNETLQNLLEDNYETTNINYTNIEPAQTEYDDELPGLDDLELFELEESDLNLNNNTNNETYTEEEINNLEFDENDFLEDDENDGENPATINDYVEDFNFDNENLNINNNSENINEEFNDELTENQNIDDLNDVEIEQYLDDFSNNQLENFNDFDENEENFEENLNNNDDYVYDTTENYDDNEFEDTEEEFDNELDDLPDEDFEYDTDNNYYEDDDEDGNILVSDEEIENFEDDEDYENYVDNDDFNENIDEELYNDDSFDEENFDEEQDFNDDEDNFDEDEDFDNEDILNEDENFDYDEDFDEDQDFNEEDDNFDSEDNLNEDENFDEDEDEERPAVTKGLKKRGKNKKNDDSTSDENDEDSGGSSLFKNIGNIFKKGYGKVTDLFYKMFVKVFGFLSKVPVVGKVFSKLVENDKLMKILSNLFLPFVIVVLVLIPAKGSVPGDYSTELPDMGSAVFTDFDYKDGMAVGSIHNTGDVVAEVTPVFTVYTIQPGILPTTWAKHVESVSCEGETVNVDIDDTKKVELKCDNYSGFLPKTSGVLQ